MRQDSERYYLFFKDWSMDPNQWSMFLDSTAVLLAVFGVLLGFFLYRKQRRDNANDAFDFFQSSLPELVQSVESAIFDISEFNRSLELDNFVNPILSAALNDKFLTKINIVHLNRYYKNNRKKELSNFKQLLVDSNFFGDYHSYITKEINFFRSNYQELKRNFSQWHLLLSNQYFSSSKEGHQNNAYKEFYNNWITEFSQKIQLFGMMENATSSSHNARNAAVLIDQVQKLTEDILPFIPSNPEAEKVLAVAHEVILSHNEMSRMKVKIRKVLEKDVARFEKVRANMNNLLE